MQESEPGRTELTYVQAKAQSSAKCNYVQSFSHLATTAQVGYWKHKHWLFKYHKYLWNIKKLFTVTKTDKKIRTYFSLQFRRWHYRSERSPSLYSPQKIRKWNEHGLFSVKGKLLLKGQDGKYTGLWGPQNPWYNYSMPSMTAATDNT